jgi:DNA-binding MarR family transcriptional regulator
MVNSIVTNHKEPKLEDYQSLAEFRYQIRRFLRFSEEAARKNGLEPRHHQLMLAVKGTAPGSEPHIGYLAERLQIRHHSAVELLDRLEKKGLIRRVRSAGDRREVLVMLTPRGERKLAGLTMTTRAELRSAAPTLVRTLKKITASASAARKLAKNVGVAGKSPKGEREA